MQKDLLVEVIMQSVSRLGFFADVLNSKRSLTEVYVRG